MTRPGVSVVMPFAGDAAAAGAALDALLSLQVHEGDELIVADNAGTVPERAGVRVVRASGERSPAHARNVGAQHAGRDWILFLDADCRPGADLLEAYFARPIDPGVGAVAGEVAGAGDADTLAGRYGMARGFLGQAAHLAHPYLPRAVAANLLVRREAFDAVGGFYEGLRAAEDTDFCWRLQRAGWRLELRAEASVEHVYRPSLRELRRQWRGYAAGRAWLHRRYRDFVPEPAAVRGSRRLLRRVGARRETAEAGAPGARDSGARDHHRLRTGERDPRFLALDVLLAAEELAGLALSNRPATDPADGSAIEVVLVADRFPSAGDPLVDFALTIDGARVEAAARPAAPTPIGPLEVAYREDEGLAARLAATAWLMTRRPLRAAADVISRPAGAPALRALAPAVRRLAHDGDVRLHPLGGTTAQATARRLAALSGRSLER